MPALLPVAFLFVGLAVVLAHDLIVLGRDHLSGGAPVVGGQRIEVHFHDSEQQVVLGEGGVKPENGVNQGPMAPAVWEPSMRFGLSMTGERDSRNPLLHKRLTFDEKGETNNTVVRLDGNEWIFGERPFRRNDGRPSGEWPGRWQQQDSTNLGTDSAGRLRRGHQSVWVYDAEQVLATQTVELVPGEQSGALDTCLVRYRLDNRDARPHSVGLRFLLDTYIGANDGVPFTIPGVSQLCDTLHDFPRPQDVPDFIQARERPDLTNPGTVAQLQLRLGGRLDPPDRVTLGAWPNPRLAAQDPRCAQEKTLWDVPLLSMKTLSPPDSAVVIYWNARELPPGGSREMGFAYGLGTVSAAEGGGRLAVTVGGALTPGGEFTVTAYVNNPTAGQTVTLTLPEGFRLTQGDPEQRVPAVPPGAASPNVPVSWKVAAPAREGEYRLEVRSSTGAAQTQAIRIKGNRLFD